MDIANKDLNINHIPGPLGVRGSSDNRLIKKKLNWGQHEFERWSNTDISVDF